MGRRISSRRRGACPCTSPSSSTTATSVGTQVPQRVPAPVQLAMACTPACEGSALDLGPVLMSAPVGEWRELKVKLGCLRDAGVDMSGVSAPLVLTTTGPFALTLLSATLSSDPAGATCPARAVTR